MRSLHMPLAVGVLALGLGTSAILPGASQAQVAPAPAAAKASAQKQVPPASERKESYRLRLTTFNILSSSMAPGGLDRARRAARWVQGQGAAAAAFQEVAKDQLLTLEHVMPGYHFYPQRTLGTRGSAIQIAWKYQELRVLKKGYVMRPFLGHERPIPYVRLIDRKTGRDFWLMAIHNAPGTHESERDISTRKEIPWIKKMLGTKSPVFVIGDVNERNEFCDKVAAATPLVSMNHGTSSRPCPVPRYGGPDWMLGAGAEFDDFKKDYNGISDHPALTALAKVPGT